MSRARTLAVAVGIFASGVVAGIIIHAHHWRRPVAGGSAASEALVEVAFENARVAVRTVDLAPGARRPSRTRPTDELVLFCEEAHYQAVTADGRTEPRDRRPGTVVWHNKGEIAPTLVNPGARPVHYYTIGLK